MCSCDITDSPFSENMASFKKLLKFSKESKCDKKVNFTPLNYYISSILWCLKSWGVFICLLNYGFYNINVNFKDEEVCKMSAENTHALKLGGGGLINSPVSDSPCSPDIVTKYVSCAFTIPPFF